MWLQELMFIFGPLARVAVSIAKTTNEVLTWLAEEIVAGLCKVFPRLAKYAGDTDGEPVEREDADQ